MTVLLFGPARDAARGASCVEVDASDVAGVTDALVDRFGEAFAAVLASSRIWVDDEPVTGDAPLDAGAVVSVLPPVSGG
ncbi:MAG: MoaD/ThiS family protein [Actinobacteria bacterium]|nr:MoaD/ThiS family protein [Actinomycetota bacterium]